MEEGSKPILCLGGREKVEKDNSMIENRIVTYLINSGYNRINVNVPDIFFTYQKKNDEVYLVSVMNMDKIKSSEEQYQSIIAQMKALFYNQDITKVYLLSIICTNSPNDVKHLCKDKDVHWILDMTLNRLIIYENQSSDFLGLKGAIEQLLEQDHEYMIQQEEGSYSGEYQAHNQRGTRKRKYAFFTLFNTIIVAINVLIFLYINYSERVGGNYGVVISGALSWEFVRYNREYYRLITSMFMHSEINHLMNNMLVLLFVGDNFERAVGKMKYLFIYFGSGILAGISSFSYNMWKDNRVYSIGASGAIFGVVGAMVYILIVNKGRMENISTRQIALFAIFSLYGGLANARVDNIAHFGGFIAGFLLAIIFYRKPKKKPDTINKEVM